MYSLILTTEERRAIDWIGHRYIHGNNLYKLLVDAHWYKIVKHGPPFQANELDNIIPGYHVTDEEDNESIVWCGVTGDYDLLFMISETLAWRIKELIDESQLECFAESLQCKLRAFAANII